MGSLLGNGGRRGGIECIWLVCLATQALAPVAGSGACDAQSSSNGVSQSALPPAAAALPPAAAQGPQG